MSNGFLNSVLAWAVFVGTITDRHRVVSKLLCEGDKGRLQL